FPMSGMVAPLAAATSLAAAIWAGTLSRPKNCVVALPEIWLWMPLGAWVAKTSPRPYFLDCWARRTVLIVLGVPPLVGAKFWASSITRRAPRGWCLAGCCLIQLKTAI